MTRLRSWPPLRIAAVVALTACAVTPSRPPAVDPEAAWRVRLANTRTLNQWKINGKLGVRTHEQGGHATIIWERHGDDHSINLYGPLGGGRVVLSETLNGAELRNNKDETYHADNAEQLLYRVAGWRVPFGAMKFWILGLPASGEPFESVIDPWGRLSELRQSGWEVRFMEYRFYDAVELPRKVFLTALEAPDSIYPARDELGENERVEVRLVIKAWSLKDS